MAKQLLGKEVTDALNAKLTERANALKEKGVNPTLGILRIGENPSDLSYERGATKRAELIGIEVQKFVLPEDATKEQVLAAIDELNANDAIHGVLMFRPLPKHLKADTDEICNRLDPKKDVDCMTDLSNAGVFEGRSDLGFAPCTPAACMEILDYYGIDCKGKNAVVIGRSLVVGTFLCQLSKVCTMLKSIINGINLLFSSLLLINSSTLFHQHEDMSQLSHTTIAIDALLCLGIYLMSLSLNISIGNHSRTYLLIAITSKLIEE